MEGNKNNNPELSLNFIQSIAMRGQVADIISTCKNKADREYSSFVLVTLAPEEHYAYYYNIIKEHLDEQLVDTYFLYRSTYKVPYHLWINKIKSDILTSKCHKDIIRSRFIKLLRTCVRLNDYATKLLITDFLNDNDFDYMQDILLYFSEVIENKEGTDSIEPWDTYEDQVNQLFEKEKIKDKAITIEKCEFIVGLQVYPMTFNAFGILEVEEELNIKEKKSNVNESNGDKFMVKKVLKENNRVVSEREFKNAEEAMKYKESILNDYPELASQFDFRIEKRTNAY